MIDLATMDHVSSRRDDESSDGCALSSLYEVRPEELPPEGNIHLQRSVLSRNGGRREVEILITLSPWRSLEAAEMAAILRHSCRKYFEYAASSAHEITMANVLEDAAGNKFGEVLASFRSARLLLREPRPARARDYSVAKVRP